MDGRDQQQPPPQPPRVSSPPATPGVVMPQHAYGPAPAMPPGPANVMHGMPLAFNPMASPTASSAMKPADMAVAMYRPDSGPPATQQQQQPAIGAGAIVISGGGGELVKKKRGRPRKYGPDGTLGMGPKPASEAGRQSGGAGSNSNPDGKRRGRPPGSGKKKQLDALGSSGTSFTPHIITVKPNEDVASKILSFSQQGPRTTCIISATGSLCTATLRQPATSGGIVTYEDVASKILSFSQQGPRTTCIISATGSLCTATLRQPATSGGIVTYEGHFEILSLSGSYLLAEDGDTRSRTGGLSVALAGSDGRIVGGSVAGMLMAANLVQVVVGSFIAEGKKPKEEQVKREPTPVPPMQTAGFAAAPSAATPPSDGTSSDHSDDPGSPMGPSPNGAVLNNAGHPVHASYAPVGWSIPGNQSRYDPDLKIMND